MESKKESSVAVSKKGGQNGSYDNYSNSGNQDVSNSVINDTSLQLSKYENDGTARTRASIGSNATVISREGDINVTALENVSAVVITGGVGAGGGAGVGASISVTIIGSNVEAEISSFDTVIDAAKSVNVTARLTHDNSKTEPSAKSNPIGKLNDALKAALSKKDDLEKDSTKTAHGIKDFGILVLSIAGGGGFVGGAVNVAYFNDSSSVKASVSGRVNQRDSGGALNITADARLGNIGVFTGSLAAGAVGVAATVALATVESEVKAALRGWYSKPHTVKGDANIISSAAGTLHTINGALAAGGVAGTVIVSIANNRLNSYANVSRYAALEVGRNLRVQSSVSAGLKSYIANVSAGAVAVAVTVSIANNRANSYAYIGDKDDFDYIKDAYVKAGTVKVESTVKGDVQAVGRSLSGGAVAANGAVVIAIQRSTNRAEITSNRVTTSGPNDRIDILAKMDGNARVDVIAVTAGAAALGAVVAVSYINTTNYAYAEVDYGELRSSVINVVAGGATEQYYKTGAVTTAITGAAGAFAAAFNFAYATNNAQNAAMIDLGGRIESKNVNVRSYALNTALAAAANAGLAALSANVTRVRAVLEGENRAVFRSRKKAVLKTGGLYVEAYHNLESTKPESVALFSEEAANKITLNPTSPVEAYIFSGAAALASVATNLATAKSDFTVTSRITLGTRSTPSLVLS